MSIGLNCRTVEEEEPIWWRFWHKNQYAKRTEFLSCDDAMECGGNRVREEMAKCKRHFNPIFFTLIHSFIYSHSLNKFLSRTYYMPSIVLNIEDKISLFSRRLRWGIYLMRDVGQFTETFFFGHTHSIWTSLGQRSNLQHNSDPSHCSDNTRSLTH